VSAGFAVVLFFLVIAALMSWMFARSITVPWGAPWGNHLKTLWFLGRTFSLPLLILYFAFAEAARTRGLPLPPRAIACGLGFLVCLACMAGEYFSRGEYYGVNDPWEYTLTIVLALGGSAYFFLRWTRGRKIRAQE
jgi:energy-coupling factor transporter transmembrane protein EcfT